MIEPNYSFKIGNGGGPLVGNLYPWSKDTVSNVIKTLRVFLSYDVSIFLAQKLLKVDLGAFIRSLVPLIVVKDKHWATKGQIEMAFLVFFSIKN